MNLMLRVRGKPSTTFTLIVGSWIAVTYVFVTKGSAGDVASYGAAVVAILAPWIAREGIEKMGVKQP